MGLLPRRAASVLRMSRELTLDLVHRLEQLHVESALINDLSAKNFIDLLVLRDLHKTLHGLIHILLAKSFKLLELGVHLMFVSQVSLHILLMFLDLTYIFHG